MINLTPDTEQLDTDQPDTFFGVVLGAELGGQTLIEKKVGRLNGRIQSLQQQSRTLTQVRVITFIGGALLSGFTFVQWGAWPWLLVTLLVFVPFLVSVFLHQRVETAVTKWTTWRDIKQMHLARMNLDWTQLSPPLQMEVARDHPFAVDVDVLGEFSLHRVLDTAVSESGRQRLAQWLLETDPDAPTILLRQQQVEELTRLPHFRDKLILQAMLVARQAKERVPGEQLVAWLETPAQRADLRKWTLLLSGLAVVTAVSFALTFMDVLPTGAWLLPWVIYVGLYVIKGLPLTGAMFNDAVFLQNSLDVLQGVFRYLESYGYGRSPQIARLCQPFLNPDNRPSHHIRRVRRVMAGIGLRQNPIIGLLINAVVPWDLFFAYRLALCKADLREQMPLWLDRWFELEALDSLATFAWLHEGDVVLPQLETAVSIQFNAQQLGHPLIPKQNRICNDFQVEQAGSVMIITGSNMAGKSSFLRTVGVNLVLAYAGGAVVAQSFSTSFFRLFASIRVQDSLTDGYSFFYAEVRRLAQLLEALKVEGERPLFFLIDEIFRGTNNRERLIGSQAYLTALAQGSGVGIVATHDLELVHLADDHSTIRNYHFRDSVENGRMVFDYRLHEGPCPTTNALKIMQLAGLPLPDEADENEPASS